jgi:hypothetical protein
MSTPQDLLVLCGSVISCLQTTVNASSAVERKAAPHSHEIHDLERACIGRSTNRALLARAERWHPE